MFGPGQVAWEGATGAIAAFAARALDGEPIVIPGDPERTRDFVYVDDVVAAVEAARRRRRWNETVLACCRHADAAPAPRAELVRGAAGSQSPIETPGGELPPGENESWEAPDGPGLECVRPLEQAISDYVDWLRTHPAAQGRARA